MQYNSYNHSHGVPLVSLGSGYPLPSPRSAAGFPLLSLTQLFYLMSLNILRNPVVGVITVPLVAEYSIHANKHLFRIILKIFFWLKNYFH